ncbi:MAG: limonene-1,2-epoxide hydrolase family protein [Acidimicrobiales bacterium]|nr:limonene-1,2-epoxide hydrolase family protein [Acidimicrobiales bacterium]MDG2219355.1 limonene-1,2-epoxide hydrolase family protein [Acidimicrobiales bacterium]
MTPAEIVTDFIRAIERKDVAAAASFVAENISYENMPMAPIVGREAMMATLEVFLAPAERVDWQILDQWEVGRTVINERLDRFEIGDGWLELPLAGIFEVNDGNKISLWRDYFDMGSYTRQMATLTGS